MMYKKEEPKTYTQTELERLKTDMANLGTARCNIYAEITNRTNDEYILNALRRLLIIENMTYERLN